MAPQYGTGILLWGESCWSDAPFKININVAWSDEEYDVQYGVSSPGWDASPSQGHPPHWIRLFSYIHLGGERYPESKLSVLSKNTRQCPLPGLARIGVERTNHYTTMPQGFPQHWVRLYPYIHLGGERHPESKLSVLSTNTTQCPLPGLARIESSRVERTNHYTTTPPLNDEWV